VNETQGEFEPMKSRFLFAFLVPLLAGCSLIDPCENAISQTVTSPDGAHQVIVFTRGCGATTSDSTQVSLLPTGQNVGDEDGNVLALGDEESVKVQWKDTSTVSISFIRLSKTFKKEAVVNNVHIRYN